MLGKEEQLMCVEGMRGAQVPPIGIRLAPQFILAGFSPRLDLESCNWKEERSEMKWESRSQGFAAAGRGEENHVERDASWWWSNEALMGLVWVGLVPALSHSGLGKTRTEMLLQQ